ncbi:MAG TPA: hypothetical protein VIC84_20260 [Blastocatellia bacterium]|jgi:hypothetical protein
MSPGCRVTPFLSADGAPPLYILAPGAELLTVAVTTLICAAAVAWLIPQQKIIATTHKIGELNMSPRHVVTTLVVTTQ